MEPRGGAIGRRLIVFGGISSLHDEIVAARVVDHDFGWFALRLHVLAIEEVKSSQARRDRSEPRYATGRLRRKAGAFFTSCRTTTGLAADPALPPPKWYIDFTLSDSLGTVVCHLIWRGPQHDWSTVALILGVVDFATIKISPTS